MPDRTWGDTVPFKGKYYWPQGPFPAILMTPFVFVWQSFGQFFYQGILNYLLVILTFGLIYKIAKKNNFSPSDSLLLSLAFCIASAYVAVALSPAAWYFAQNVTVFLILLALYEFLGKKRYWWIGLIFGFVFATRVTAGFGIVFFLMEILLSKADGKTKTHNLVKLISPVLITFSLLGYYNYVRFGNVFEQGYQIQLLLNNALVKNRSYGLFSLQHIPQNLYRFFLAGPLPVLVGDGSQVLKFPFIRTDNWGMSVFLTSPYLVYLLFLKYKDRLSFILIASIFAIAFPIFCYYGIGYNQFGYRYSLDFLPFVFFLLIRLYHQQFGDLSLRFKLFVVSSAILDLYLFYTWVLYHYA